MNSLGFAYMVNRIVCGDDVYLKRKFFRKFSLEAGIEEGLHAYQYRNDPYTYLKRLDKKQPDITSYQMDETEIEAKEEVLKIVEEIGDKYDSMLDELVNNSYNI